MQDRCAEIDRHSSGLWLFAIQVGRLPRTTGSGHTNAVGDPVELRAATVVGAGKRLRRPQRPYRQWQAAGSFGSGHLDGLQAVAPAGDSGGTGRIP